MHGIPDHADYVYVRERLVLRVTAEERDGHPFASVDAKILAEHDTETRRRGDPCRSCAEPWPCGTVLGILAPE